MRPLLEEKARRWGVQLLQSGKLPQTTSLKIWADNCTGQNKNYALYTTLYGAMRRRLLRFRELIIEYFVPGHSQMAADSFHASIERQMKKASSFFYEIIMGYCYCEHCQLFVLKGLVS